MPVRIGREENEARACDRQTNEGFQPVLPVEAWPGQWQEKDQRREPDETHFSIEKISPESERDGRRKHGAECGQRNMVSGVERTAESQEVQDP